MDYNLLQPAVLKDLKEGDAILHADCEDEITVKYKGNLQVLLEYPKGPAQLLAVDSQHSFKLKPLCWVEGKPVYKGDKLYWDPKIASALEVRGMIIDYALGVPVIVFTSGARFPPKSLSWTSPKPAPSFQVEGKDVFPGDEVYYYGSDRSRWGIKFRVTEHARVIDEYGNVYKAVTFIKGANSFRLTKQCVIGDRFFPEPVREPLSDGVTYYIPQFSTRCGYSVFTWHGWASDLTYLRDGLIHLTYEAAVDHTEALKALTKGKQ